MRKKAFTLVELLVVISVIAMLMGILLPVLNKARQSGKSTVCKANLHSIAVAFRMYLDDNRNLMPDAASLPYSETDLNQTSYPGKPPIIKFLGSYLGVTNNEMALVPTKKVYSKTFFCPADRNLTETDGVKGPNYNTLQYWYKVETTSYWYNETIKDLTPAQQASLLKQFGGPANVSIIYDQQNFHGNRGANGAYNYLYADGHIGDRRKQ